MGRVQAGWKHHRVYAEHHAGQHSDYVDTRAEKCAKGTSELHEDQTRDREQRKDVSPRPLAKTFPEVRLDAEAGERDQNDRDENEPPKARSGLTGSCFEAAFGLISDPQSTVLSEGQKCGNSRQDRIPVEDGGFAAHGKIGPQRQEEEAVGIERHPADYVTQGCAEENGQQHAGAAEYHVPEGTPDGALDVIAKLDRDAAQDQQPEDNHQREIKAAETGGVEGGESEIESAAAGEQP